MSVFSTPPPNYSMAEAIGLVKTFYGIKVKAKPLDSERDQNFLVQNEHQSFVLKIFNPAEEYDVLDMQNKVLQYIVDRDTGFDLTLPIPSLRGEDIIKVEQNGQSNWVRMLKYIDGQFLRDSKHHDTMLFELGAFLGRLDHAMEGFDHSAAKRDFPWDTRNLDFLRSHKHFIETNSEIVDYFLEQYESIVTVNESQLRKMVIHNDGNDHNVLVNENGKTTGIIDFGDMIYTYVALEPSVCMAYVALEKDDPLASISEVLKGYHRTFELNKYELGSVIYLMCLRLCIIVTMAAYRKSLFPDNDYICVTENQAWDFLTKMKNENLAKRSGEIVTYAQS
ncbi:MAG: phosphotransferase [Candidatus Marinimicrobia bacterium]|nr:phosphotransferase [Candidatus Neomarinimicrobiota bacterium]